MAARRLRASNLSLDEPGNFLVVIAAMTCLALGILAFARWRHWV